MSKRPRLIIELLLLFVTLILTVFLYSTVTLLRKESSPSTSWVIEDVAPELDLVMVETFSKASLVFDSPEEIPYETSEIVALAVSQPHTFAELLSILEYQVGRKLVSPDTALIFVSPRMSAVLTGQDFLITELTPHIQAIFSSSETIWNWSVTPQKWGRKKLHLTLSALIPVDGQPTPKAVMTYSREINVTVSFKVIAAQFLNRHVKWLWTILVIPAVPILRRLVLSRRKRSPGFRIPGKS